MSVLRSVIMAFADAFNMTHSMQHEVQRLTRMNIPITMMSNMLSLFEVLTKETCTTKKRLMIGLHAVKDASKRLEVNAVAIIRSAYDITDALSKVKSRSALLRTFSSNFQSHPVGQCIIRCNPESVSVEMEEGASM